HLAGAILVRVLVRNEVVAPERLALLPDVAMGASNAERAREAAHHGRELRGREILREDLRVLHLLGPVPFILADGRRRDEPQKCEKRESLPTSGVEPHGRPPERDFSRSVHGRPAPKPRPCSNVSVRDSEARWVSFSRICVSELALSSAVPASPP